MSSQHGNRIEFRRSREAGLIQLFLVLLTAAACVSATVPALAGVIDTGAWGLLAAVPVGIVVALIRRQICIRRHLSALRDTPTPVHLAPLDRKDAA